MSTATLLRRNRNFARYWTADVVSTTGSAVSAIAVPLLALALGGSVARAGLIGTGALLVRLFCRFPAGQLADRFDRRWLMLSADLIRMVVLGSIPVAAGLGVLGFEQLLVVALIDAVTSSVFGAAAGIAMRDVVPDEDMTTALSGTQASNSAVMLIGPVLGGFLFGIDRILPFTVDAISYFISAVLLIGMTVRPPEPTAGGKRDNRVLAGLHWLRGQPQLLWVLGFAGAINLIGSALEIGLVISLRGQGQNGSSIGVVMACLGAGSIVGALCAPRLIALLPAGPLFLVTGLIWAIGLAGLALQPPLLVVCAILLVLLLFTPSGVILLSKAVMVSCPREILGRVNTAIGTSLMGLATVGPLLISLLIARFGVGHAWAVLSIGTLVILLATGRPLLRLSSLVDEPTAEAPLSRAEDELVRELEPEVVAHRLDAEVIGPDDDRSPR